MIIVKDRFWLLIELNNGVLNGNFNFGDWQSFSGVKLRNEDLGHREYFRDLKAFMRGVAGVLVDQVGGRLTLATDAYGMLPVFYYQTDDTYYFFTHFPDLLDAFPDIILTPDPAGIWEGMIYDQILGGRTIFKEISMLPPSTMIAIDCRSGAKSMSAYDGLKFERISDIDEREAGQRVADLLKEVLARMEGDHFLLPLSGGVDSRLLAAAMVDLLGPDRITALSFACNSSSYEFIYAKKTCEILGIKDWRGHILTQESYLRSLKVFPSRFGGELSISNGHLYDALSTRMSEWAGKVLVSGAFADAAGGFHADPPEFRYKPVEESHYYRHLIKLDSFLRFGKSKEFIEQDIRDNHAHWQDGSTIMTFDEYAYITNRQPRMLFLQSLSYKDILPVVQPFADRDLSEFLFALPFELRRYKRAIRAAIRHINPEVYDLPDISSKMLHDSWPDRLHIYRGKVLNNLNLLLTCAFGDRKLFFSPYQTECQDYNLRTIHRRLALKCIDILLEYDVISSDQGCNLKKKPYKLYRGLHLACAQYWAITIAITLSKFAKKAN